ncbi:MAG: hypothetical protein Q8J64_06945, partial [Thermodesulfovibrionales bacterium]|nr:hypothetical protein [Thermodesulfovibrionales bacterium]
AKTFNFNGSHIGSLSADGISVKGNVFLSGVKAKGEVRLLGAKIGGQLDCENAEFVNEEGYAFSADGISVKGDMFLRGVKAKGEVRLLGANIGGQLSCKDAEFVNKEGYAFNATSAIINELLLWETKFKGRLSLSRAKVKVLADDEQSRPDKGKLSIDGFEYEMFRLPKNENAEKRLGWIRLMTESSFYAQPYEQLAKVFKQMGHETDRKKALYEKHEDLRKYGALSKKGKLWNRFLGVTIGHGYKTWRLLLWIIPIILLGAGLFCYADNLEVMQPSKERVYLDPDFKRTGVLPERYSRFNAFIYSIDAFFPFVDLHQEGYYLPDSTRQHGNRFRYYLWLHIFSGWVFSTLAMAAFTGIVRRE